MSDLNFSVLSGRLCWDATAEFTKNGKRVARLALAVNEFIPDENGNTVEVTDFIPLTVFLKENDRRLDYMRKGQSVIVEGKTRISRWEKDGKKSSRLYISVRKISFVFAKRDTAEKNVADENTALMAEIASAAVEEPFEENTEEYLDIF